MKREGAWEDEVDIGKKKNQRKKNNENAKISKHSPHVMQELNYFMISNTRS